MYEDVIVFLEEEINELDVIILSLLIFFRVSKMR